MPIKHFFVRLLGTRPGWPDNMTETEKRIMSEHFNYLQDLVARKKVAAAGPVFRPVFGLIIIQAASEVEAKAIMEKEPSVAQGVHTYEMSEMVLSLLMHNLPGNRFPKERREAFIHKEVEVTTTLKEAWDAWTTNEGIPSFFGEDCNVELRSGGPFEIFFSKEAPAGERGSEDCRILSYLPMQMLSFEWNAPPQFGKLRQMRTQVIIQFTETDSSHVKVSLTNHGYGIGEDWDKLFEYFDRAWGFVLNSFKKRFEGQ